MLLKQLFGRIMLKLLLLEVLEVSLSLFVIVIFVGY